MILTEGLLWRLGFLRLTTLELMVMASPVSPVSPVLLECFLCGGIEKGLRFKTNKAQRASQTAFFKLAPEKELRTS